MVTKIHTLLGGIAWHLSGMDVALIPRNTLVGRRFLGKLVSIIDEV